MLLRAARECYRWLLWPHQETPTQSKPGVEAFPVNTTAGAVEREIKRVCVGKELVIAAWSPVHLRRKLWELYWKADRPTVGAADFWEDSLRYSIYLDGGVPPTTGPVDPDPQPKLAVRRRFYGTTELNPVKAKFDFNQIVEEVLMQLSTRPDAEVRITVEIHAETTRSFDEKTQRDVKENCNTLRFKIADFE